MKYPAENAVSSFFYYMWNAWSKEECKLVYGNMYRHFWDKWSALADKSIFGAAERFYAELSENNQKLLVGRAVTLYDGRAFRKEPDDEDTYVCEICGSKQIGITAWVDVNTGEHLSDSDNSGREWCDECEDHNRCCTLKDFKDEMQSWWDSCDSATMARITGLRDNGSQQFSVAANGWWDSLDYGHKREIYNKYNSNNERYAD